MQINIEALKKDTQRYRAEGYSHEFDGKASDNQTSEAAATALLLDAYMILSDRFSPEYARDFIKSASTNIDELVNQIIHENYQ